MDKPKHKYEDLLMEAIGFTEEDLASNREGQLGDNQRTILMNRRNFWLVRTGFGSLVLLALALLVVIKVNANPEAKLGLIGLVSYFLGMYIYPCYLNLRNVENDLVKGIISEEGRIQLDVRDGNHCKDRYWLITQATRFKINKNQFLAFKNGDPYVIYYAPKSKIVLAAEWVYQ
jgi:hypothetical protein